MITRPAFSLLQKTQERQISSLFVEEIYDYTSFTVLMTLATDNAVDSNPHIMH